MPMHAPRPGSPEAQFIIRRYCQELLWEESAEICATAREVCDATRALLGERWLLREARRLSNDPAPKADK